MDGTSVSNGFVRNDGTRDMFEQGAAYEVRTGQMLVRAIGPSLSGFGVPNALQDPTLELHDGSGAIVASNDDWRETQETAIEATGIPPSNNKESAILSTLPPGGYTAIVRGFGNTTGVGLVEVYNLQ
jgi:hypothetical protein